MSEHRKSLTVKQHNHRLVYQTVYWWLKFGGRPESELQCIHGKTLNVYCDTCTKEVV